MVGILMSVGTARLSQTLDESCANCDKVIHRNARECPHCGITFGNSTYFPTKAGWQAMRHGDSYADYIETHGRELVAKGIDPQKIINQSLGEALIGNDGD